MTDDSEGLTRALMINRVPGSVVAVTERPRHRGWLRLYPTPDQVAVARRWAYDALWRDGLTDQDRIYDVVVTVSELVTNAIERAIEYAAARSQAWSPYEQPVGLRVLARPRWVHVWVSDPDSAPIERTPQDVLAQRGRGLDIAEALAGASGLLWVTQGDWGKTVQTVLPHGGVVLTGQEQELLRARVIL